MGHYKKKKRTYTKKRKGNQNLSGVAEHVQNNKQAYLNTLKEGGLILLTAIAAGGAGAAIGKHSLVAGLPLTLIGIHKKNKFIIAAGLGLTLSNGFQNPAKAESKTSVDGFDIKQITQDAKDRVGTFFQNFKEKLYLVPAEVVSTTDGLGGNGEEITYFVNPYSNKELDTSALDRVQEQIAAMNSSTDLNDVDREF